jgi:hypothetical protein
MAIASVTVASTAAPLAAAAATPDVSLLVRAPFSLRASAPFLPLTVVVMAAASFLLPAVVVMATTTIVVVVPSTAGVHRRSDAPRRSDVRAAEARAR